MPPKSVTRTPKQTSSKVKAQDSQHPPPFEKAPISVEAFLSQLDPSKIYITHIDRHRPDYKRQIFLITVLVNVTITALLIWRVYDATPKYLAFVQTLLGYASSATVDTKKTTRREQTWILLRRTLMMILDFCFFRLLGPWPLTFFLERPANPVTWRWKIRFLPQEIVVRVCRNWTGEDLMKGTKRGDQNPYFKTRILPAVDEQQMRKTGYLMMDGSWDLDFGLMLDAHFLIKEKKIEIQDLDKLVLAHQDGGAGWLVWKFEQEVDVGDENNSKMKAFRDLLSNMGKESLFWRWQAIVEEERDADGGFTPEAQKRVADRVAEAFAKDGVDFAKLMRSVGGVQAPPTK